MRAGAGVLLAGAVLLCTVRTMSGIEYRRDEPVACLAIARAPALSLAWAEGDRSVFSLVDCEEGRLSYGWLYLDAMRGAPFVAAAMLGAALIAARRRRAA